MQNRMGKALRVFHPATIRQQHQWWRFLTSGFIHADGDSLTAVLDSTTSSGSLTLNADGSFSYTPNANFNGSDAFTYHANDGQDNSNVVTVSITVNDINDAPVADANGPYSGSVDVAVTFDGSGSSDVDGTIASYAWDFGDATAAAASARRTRMRRTAPTQSA